VEANGQRVSEVDHASFIPVVLSATRGLAHEATVFISDGFPFVLKWGKEHLVVIGWLRCLLGFSLLYSAIQYICGARFFIGSYTGVLVPMDLVRVEFHLVSQAHMKLQLAVLVV